MLSHLLAAFALILSSATTAVSDLEAQNVARWHVMVDMVIPSSRSHLASVAWIGMRSDGSAVVDPGALATAREVSSRGEVSLLQLPRSRPFIVRGLVGDTVWGTDVPHRAIFRLSVESKVEPWFDFPTSILLPSGDVLSIPTIMGSLGSAPMAMEPDGTILAGGLVSPLPPAWNRPPDGGEPYYRIDRNGALRNLVAWRQLPSAGCRKLEFTFCTAVPSTVARDGRGIAITDAAIAGRDSGTIRVIMIASTGDTMYDRRYPYQPRPISRRVADSTVKALLGRSTKPQWIAHIQADIHPTIYPPVVSLFLDLDGRLWVEQPRDQSAVEWLVIDSAGTMIRRVTAPIGLRIMTARGDVGWGVRLESDGAFTLVRLRFEPS